MNFWQDIKVRGDGFLVDKEVRFLLSYPIMGGGLFHHALNRDSDFWGGVVSKFGIVSNVP